MKQQLSSAAKHSWFIDSALHPLCQYLLSVKAVSARQAGPALCHGLLGVLQDARDFEQVLLNPKDGMGMAITWDNAAALENYVQRLQQVAQQLTEKNRWACGLALFVLYLDMMGTCRLIIRPVGKRKSGGLLQLCSLCTLSCLVRCNTLQALRSGLPYPAV